MSRESLHEKFLREMREDRADFCRHIDRTFGDLRAEVQKIDAALSKLGESVDRFGRNVRTGMDAGLRQLEKEIEEFRRERRGREADH
jgi:hypothetical protein